MTPASLVPRSPSPAPDPPLLPALALEPGQTGRLLAALLPWLGQGRRCYCLDGGNVFNPYELALQARAQGLDPAPLLERIFVSRAYTCHQLLEAASTMLDALAGQADPPLTLILAIERLFLDDDLPLGERRRIFARLVQRLARLLRRGLPLLVTLTNAECGMRNAECMSFYAPFQMLTKEFSFPEAAFPIPLGSGAAEILQDFSPIPHSEA